jgi:hypothetical protein
MHFAHPPIRLPSDEYARLQRLMLTMIGDRSTLASILRSKLGSAECVPAAELTRDVALSGVPIRFRIDGQRSLQRTLTWHPLIGDDTIQLSLLSPRGLALLGLTPGQLVSYRTDGDRAEFLELEQVLAQQSRRSAKNFEATGDDVDVALQFITPGDALAGGLDA